ncbi:MAG TPA: DUF6159 family protein [Pseudonocardiaceae bacterium]|jgi:hypothetical protein|nr:DUF6159 family protein [Pseudonocardiaceae bacterium]
MGWTFTLLRASLRVVGAHRRLLVFPIVSGVSIIALLAATVLPVWQLSLGGHGLRPISWLLMGAGYFLLSLVAIFCNSALVHAANLALRGGAPTVAAGFRGAAGRFGPIVLWSLISCTVSLLLRALEVIKLGELIEAILGLAWQLTTYMVVPLIVVERDSVPGALRRSREMLRRTWGTNASGSIGIAVWLLLIALIGVGALIGVAALVNSVTHDVNAAVLTAGIGIPVWLVLLILLGGTASTLFRVALYRFAAEGTIVPQFRGLDLSSTF